MKCYNLLKTLAVSAGLFAMGASSVMARNPPQPVCQPGYDNVLVETDITAMWNSLFYVQYYPDQFAYNDGATFAENTLCPTWLAPPDNYYQRRFGATQKKCHVYIPNPTQIGNEEEYFGGPGNPATLWFVGCARLIPDPKAVGPRSVIRQPANLRAVRVPG